MVLRPLPVSSKIIGIFNFLAMPQIPVKISLRPDDLISTQVLFVINQNRLIK